MSATPGPWEIITEDEGFAGCSATGKDLGIVDGDNNIIAEVFWQLDDDLFADVEANARLIAAAPAMLEALGAIPLDEPLQPRHIVMIKQALAQAEGEE